VVEAGVEWNLDGDAGALCGRVDGVLLKVMCCCLCGWKMFVSLGSGVGMGEGGGFLKLWVLCGGR
jgi:hypothetical protein